MPKVTDKEEIRKIQITGGSTFIVSLPKEWVKLIGLQKGSSVRILQKDDMTLCLQPQDFETKVAVKKAIIAPRYDDTPESLVRRVVSAYLMGYNIIQLHDSERRIESRNRLAVIDFTRRKLVGTEILSDLPGELTLQVLLSYSELSITDVLRRMALIAVAMHKDSINSLDTDDLQIPRDIMSMDDEVDRFNLYIIRLLKAAVADGNVLNEIGLKTPRECLGYRLITKSVERMADHAENIARNRLELAQKIQSSEINNSLKSLSEKSLEIFEESMKAVFEADYILADRILEKANQVRRMEIDVRHLIVSHASPGDVPALRLIIESILRTAEYGADIAEVVLNMTKNETLV